MPNRTVFFVSDGTGITAETFGNSILAQFPASRATCGGPSSTPIEKARPVVARDQHHAQAEGRAADRLHHAGQRRGARHRSRDDSCKGLVLDMFRTFVEPLEAEFGIKIATTASGRFTDAAKSQEYNDRIEAINFSLAHDDGQSARNLEQADVILVGVSRSGKTPTSLYLAMQHGIKAANYPLIPEDFERGQLPSSLAPHKRKCFGLTIDPERLAQIRNERRPAAIRGARELPLRGQRGRGDDAARRHLVAVVDAQVDRGDRDDDPARHPARPADLLKPQRPSVAAARTQADRAVALRAAQRAGAPTRTGRPRPPRRR